MSTTTIPISKKKTRFDFFTDFDQVPVVLSAEEVGIVLNVCKNTVYELIRTGSLKGKRVGQQIRVLKSDLLDYMGAEAA